MLAFCKQIATWYKLTNIQVFQKDIQNRLIYFNTTVINFRSLYYSSRVAIKHDFKVIDHYDNDLGNNLENNARNLENRKILRIVSIITSALAN